MADGYDGQMKLTRAASRVNSQVGPVLDEEVTRAAAGQSKEQLADTEAALRQYLPQVQQKVAAARDDNEASAIVEEEKRLIQERADIGKRGLSTGERIALAILSSAPLVASAAYGTDFNAAAQGSGQIRQGFVDANELQKKTEIGQKDVELERLDKRKGLLSKKEETAEERAFKREQDKTKHGYDVELELLKQRGANKDPIKREERLIKRADGIRRSQAKQISEAQKTIADSEKLQAIVEGNPKNAGFADLNAMYQFIQNLDDSVVRAEDLKNFQAAKGILRRADNWLNRVLNGESLDPAARQALVDLQKISAKAAMNRLNNVVTPKMKTQLKKEDYNDEDIGRLEDHVIGGFSQYGQKLRQESLQEQELEELRQLRARKGSK